MHQKIHVSVFLAAEIDRALDERAQMEGVGKADLIVEYIAQGLCVPDAVPRGNQEEPPPVRPTATSPRIRRTIYLDFSLQATLSSRAAAEDMNSSRVAERFCVEGLARPPSSGKIQAKTKERLVAFRKARIEDFKLLADEAARQLASEIAQFRTSCPHVRVIETPECWVDEIWHPGEGQGSRPGAKMCEDCGLGEAPHPMLDRFRERVLDGSVARAVDPQEFKRLYKEHPYRFVP